MALVAALLAAAIFGVVSVRMRLTEVDIDTHAAASSDDLVFLFVGADSGIDRIEHDVQYEGERADILLLVRLSSTGEAQVVSVPRDIVATGRGKPERLALTLLDGPSQLVEAVCTTLGVTVDRYVQIDSVGFVEAVDALDGIDISMEYAIRDPAAELDLPAAQNATLTGDEALALVRSRHGEQRINGEWVSVSEAQGASDRAARGTTILGAVRTELTSAAPLSVVRAVWAASDNLTVGGGLHATEWIRLARAPLQSRTLAVQPLGSGTAVEFGDAGRSDLLAAGFDTSCES